VATIPAPATRSFVINSKTTEEDIAILIAGLELSDLPAKAALEEFRGRYRAFVDRNAKYIDRAYIGG
jgi:hypothetical protein